MRLILVTLSTPHPPVLPARDSVDRQAAVPWELEPSGPANRCAGLVPLGLVPPSPGKQTRQSAGCSVADFSVAHTARAQRRRNAGITGANTYARITDTGLSAPELLLRERRVNERLPTSFPRTTARSSTPRSSLLAAESSPSSHRSRCALFSCCARVPHQRVHSSVPAAPAPSQATEQHRTRRYSPLGTRSRSTSPSA